MSIDLIALASASGLPLASRRADLNRGLISRGDDAPGGPGMALNTVTTLYGLNLFTRLNDSELQFASSEHSQIKWKQFNGSILMVVVVEEVDFLSESDLSCLLELANDAIVLMCGLSDMSDANVERLKRRIKMAYPLLDHLLATFARNGTRRLSLVSGCTAYALTSRSSYICSLVNNIAQAASTGYCALFVHRKLLAASRDWWSSLTSTRDAFLVSCLLASFFESDLIQTKEVLIHLPSSPTTLTRLVVSQVTKGVFLCLLLGEHPSLEFIESQILVPLSDLKLQEERLSRYIYELRDCKYISPETFTDLLGKQASILKDVSAFLLLDGEHKITFAYNESLIEAFEEMISFCQLTPGSRSSCLSLADGYQTSGQMSMYRVRHGKVFILCAMYPSSTSLKHMMNRTNSLKEAFARAKHFWP